MYNLRDIIDKLFRSTFPLRRLFVPKRRILFDRIADRFARRLLIKLTLITRVTQISVTARESYIPLVNIFLHFTLRALDTSFSYPSVRLVIEETMLLVNSQWKSAFRSNAVIIYLT